jgi:hypothetical protein
MGRPPKVKEVVENVVEIPEEQKIAMATNSPSLSSDEIILDGKVFKIVHLKYDDYMLFLTLLAPVLEIILNQTGQVNNTVNVLHIIELCGKNLPQLVFIVLHQTDPEITVNRVKELCPTPFKMAEVVMLQVKHNQMIKDFASFFPQLTEMMKV